MQDPETKAKLTRKERAEIVDRVLDRYERLGGLIVGDNQRPVPLLSSLEIDVEDREIGDYADLVSDRCEFSDARTACLRSSALRGQDPAGGPRSAQCFRRRATRRSADGELYVILLLGGRPHREVSRLQDRPPEGKWDEARLLEE